MVNIAYNTLKYIFAELLLAGPFGATASPSTAKKRTPRAISSGMQARCQKGSFMRNLAQMVDVGARASEMLPSSLFRGFSSASGLDESYACLVYLAD
jgi:hypothetical protein